MITYGNFSPSKFDGENVVFVTDTNLKKLYGFSGENYFYLPEGEKAKTPENVLALCKFMLERKIDCQGTVVAIGGGSVGDTAAFAAGIYKRGITVLHVPTTIISQVDSSIGGKCGVNLGTTKNAIGLFFSADSFCDTKFLKTLSREQLQNGFSEIFKCGLLDETIDKEIANVLLHNEFYSEKLIKLCAEYKEGIVERDYFDDNLRRILNMGHTIGHAVELTSGITHGAAVLSGIYHELKLARELFPKNAAFIDKKLAILEHDTKIPPLGNIDKVLAEIENDKKNEDGEICFVLSSAPYTAEEVYLSPSDVKKYLTAED